MAISITPYIGLLCWLAQYAYPASQSILTLMEESPKSVALTQWTIFWAICVSYSLLEQHLLFILVDYFPLYQELKLLAFLWLVHPEYLGAAWLWHAKLKALHAPLDKEYYGKAMQFLSPPAKEAPPASNESTEEKEEKKEM
mmetsp:Transcript_147234/g.256969  ORF Transcript_147234/g.256969 Transcript_147234/m.256969 type:complete len:141 (-) Transcript_147234:66-488(-)